MNNMGFLRADGTLDPVTSRWSGWLPSRRQIQAAVQLDFSEGVGDLSMRQGLGLVVVAALVAGLLPFLVNWVMATQAGVAAPLVQWARSAGQAGALGPGAEVWGVAQTIAGLPPSGLPGWLAAFLSALGGWINWPLRWLAWWIVYGAGVLIFAKALGAGTTLQQFYRFTGYGAVPLVLMGLGPIPYLGGLAVLIGIVWMLLVYAAGVRAVTALDWGRTVIAVVLPGATVAMVGLLTLVSLLVSLARVIVG